MLETIDFSRTPLSKEEYRTRHDDLVKRLIVLQQKARERGIGLVVLFEGWNGAGKGSCISDLMYNLDARATSVYVTENLDVDAARTFAGAEWGVTGYYPMMQEFWQALGPRGNMTFYDRGWYTAAIQHLLYAEFGELSLKGVDEEDGGKSTGGKGSKGKRKKKVAEAMAESRRLRRIGLAERYLTSVADFERQLTDDGYAVVKFFVHVTEKAQRKRLERLHADPATRWRVSEEKLAHAGNYRKAYRLYDNLLEGSSSDYAPWHVVNGEDKRAANIAIAETLVAAIEEALDRQPDAADAEAARKARENSQCEEETPPHGERTPEQDASVLASAQREAREASARAPRSSRFEIVPDPPSLGGEGCSPTLDQDDYRRELKAEQARLNTLEMEMYQKRIPLMIMYEGWDAAGKGGNIKRVAQALDARAYTIFPSPAPTKPELLHPHLWRYWTRLPKAGHVGIYDRSWYGRVLVERVEGFASPAEWARGYDEINEFERELVQWGAILLKFWVDVSPDEQLRRFREREADPAKRWKITDEDWRNRDRRYQYKAAVEDMFRLTSTPFAPWIVLESDDKRHARVKALRIINDVLECELS